MLKSEYFIYIALAAASFSAATGTRFVKSYSSGSSGFHSYAFPGNCEIWGCPANYVCQTPRVLWEGRFKTCSKDVRAEIEARLVEWNMAWNARDFQALENFYTTDSLFLPPGAPIRRGKAGFAEFISGLIAANNWGTGEWTMDEASYVTDDHVTTVDTFRINSAGDGPVTFGKAVSLWKKVDGVYLLKYEAINFDQ